MFNPTIPAFLVPFIKPMGEIDVFFARRRFDLGLNLFGCLLCMGVFLIFSCSAAKGVGKQGVPNVIMSRLAHDSDRHSKPPQRIF
uniref:Uncharacterized protein n=1 Tax=Candidatus Kentrum sp. UNK TaxID=2126344 RepID=A0A451AUM0_9GAMM|nr:MAG: hypothetical protein BECKUNK1418G_GA0071005_100171 [Candidatus Kentron sp. UNK]VFK69746.1 MAG: hypothetical protein BECKUNK1418H_GA0071006_101838 [Candidatus Kentron sp. UNK]